jgi:hypothetical protein
MAELTIQELQDSRDALVRMRASGVRALQYSDGARLEYRNDAEIAAAIGSIERLIASPSPSAVPVSRIMFTTSKGY